MLVKVKVGGVQLGLALMALGPGSCVLSLIPAKVWTGHIGQAAYGQACYL